MGEKGGKEGKDEDGGLRRGLSVISHGSGPGQTAGDGAEAPPAHPGLLAVPRGDSDSDSDSDRAGPAPAATRIPPDPGSPEAEFSQI